MNNKLKHWVRACRPHTLPLAFSGIVLGNLLAYVSASTNWKIFTFSVLTAILLQILSNLANDYGDSKHGSDNEKRIGPQRAVQSGAISAISMKNAAITVAILSFVSGLLSLYFSLSVIGLTVAIILIGLGLLAIWAAFGYTASKKPYGYKGFGDIFVFLFFGLVAVCGSFYLQLGYVNPVVWPAAIAMGLFSAAVLNLNNIRDIENDKASGKITLAVRLGLRKAKIYHTFLILGGILFSVFFLNYVYSDSWHWLFALPLLLVFASVLKIYQAKSSKALYPMLKQLSLAVLLFVISVGISFFLVK